MDKQVSSSDVDFYTDASANPELGCGGICGTEWYILQWNEEFVKKQKPFHQLSRALCCDYCSLQLDRKV